MGTSAPDVRAARKEATRFKASWVHAHRHTAAHACVGAVVRQGEPTQPPKSPAAIKAGGGGGRDSARPMGIQAARESDETL